jgi:hypothetical protein
VSGVSYFGELRAVRIELGLGQFRGVGPRRKSDVEVNVRIGGAEYRGFPSSLTGMAFTLPQE